MAKRRQARRQAGLCRQCGQPSTLVECATCAKRKGWDDVRAAKLAAQEGRCAICEAAISGADACLDHDHATGALRDVICRSCNIAIGMLNDSPERARDVADYLERHGMS